MKTLDLFLKSLEQGLERGLERLFNSFAYEKTVPEPKRKIRWLIRDDMPEVLRIEKESFEFPWSEEDFLCCLRQRNCIGMVADYDNQIQGFMIYELHKSRLHLLNFAVDPEFRRQSVGAEMFERLIEKLHQEIWYQQRRDEILLEVRERNLDAQIFFRDQGLRAVKTLRNYYDDTDEDAYILQYRLDGQYPAAGNEALTLDTPSN